jgi:hypothetical protein
LAWAVLRSSRSPFFISAIDSFPARPDAKDDHPPLARRDAVDRPVESAVQVDAIVGFSLAQKDRSIRSWVFFQVDDVPESIAIGILAVVFQELLQTGVGGRCDLNRSL